MRVYTCSALYFSNTVLRSIYENGTHAQTNLDTGKYLLLASIAVTMFAAKFHEGAECAI